nr:hypothetical protein [Nonomuraea guangzhouensis]
MPIESAGGLERADRDEVVDGEHGGEVRVRGVERLERGGAAVQGLLAHDSPVVVDRQGVFLCDLGEDTASDERVADRLAVSSCEGSASAFAHSSAVARAKMRSRLRSKSARYASRSGR